MQDARTLGWLLLLPFVVLVAGDAGGNVEVVGAAETAGGGGARLDRSLLTARRRKLTEAVVITTRAYILQKQKGKCSQKNWACITDEDGCRNACKFPGAQEIGVSRAPELKQMVMLVEKKKQDTHPHSLPRTLHKRQNPVRHRPNRSQTVNIKHTS